MRDDIAIPPTPESYVNDLLFLREVLRCHVEGIIVDLEILQDVCQIDDADVFEIKAKLEWLLNDASCSRPFPSERTVQ